MSATLPKPSPKKFIAGVAARRKGVGRALKKHRGGVVGYYVHGPAGTLAFTPSKLIEALRAGLPVRELRDLQASLDLPMERLFPMLGISKATLHRRQAVGRLDPAESDRVVRFARLMGRAVEVMESEG